MNNEEGRNNMIKKITAGRLCTALVLAAFFLCASWPSSARAEVELVRAEGSAMMGERESTAKGHAFEDALRKAVSASVEGLLPEDDRHRLREGLERDVYSNPMRYVQNYRVLAEGMVTHYDLPDAEPDALPEAAPAAGPVSGEEEEEDFLPEGEGPPVPQPAPPVSFAEFYHIWVEAAVDVGQLKQYLKKVTTLAVRQTISVNVIILDVEDYGAYAALKKRIEGMAAVKEVSYHSFSRGKFVLKAVVATTAYGFYEGLAAMLGGEFVVLPSGAESVIVKAGRFGQGTGAR